MSTFDPPCIVHFKNKKKRTVHSENHHFKINQKASGYRLRTTTCTIAESVSGNAT